MANTEFKAALNQVATERGIQVEDVLESIRMALASAYKKDYEVTEDEKEDDEIVVLLDPNTGEASIHKDGKDVTPSGFGRIAAQTAKQVILQKIRETEKQVIFEEFEDKIGTIVMGIIFRNEGGRVVMDLGKAHGIMPQSEQVDSEIYRTNQRMKVYVKDVHQGSRGTEIIISRSDANFVKLLFEQEVPEIASGVVEIKAIAREAGSRTKMAVVSSDDKIDPVGSCVGQKGVRVQSIIAELYGEKIDIIPYSDQIEKFIAASLSPARVTEVVIDEAENKAVVSVPEDQQSLAIGKEGQNARLANKLTKWKIDIKGTKGLFESAFSEEDTNQPSEATSGVWDAAIEKASKDEDQEKVALESAENEEETKDSENTDSENKEKEPTKTEASDNTKETDQDESVDKEQESD